MQRKPATRCSPSARAPVTSPAPAPRFSLPLISLLAALLCSCVVVIPFLPSLGPAARSYVFEFELSSDTPGEAQFFYDIGRGFSEADSARAAVSPGEDRPRVV